MSRANGSADVLGYKVSPANAYCSGTSKRISRTRSVARTVSSRRCISGGRWGDGARQWSRVFLWHSAIVVLSRSLMPASNLRGRSPSRRAGGQLCVWNEEHLGEFSVFTALIGVVDGLMSASVRMHPKRGFAFDGS